MDGQALWPARRGRWSRRPASTRPCATRLARSTRTCADIELVNFKVRILDETKGTGAVTRVLLDASDGHAVWGSIGVSENVIEASWDALVDSLEYGMQAGRRGLSGAPPRVVSAGAGADHARQAGDWRGGGGAACSRFCVRALSLGPLLERVRAGLRLARRGGARERRLERDGGTHLALAPPA